MVPDPAVTAPNNARLPTVNLYEYGAANPILFIDRDGTETYILVDTSGRKIDRDAVATREREILEDYQSQFPQENACHLDAAEDVCSDPPKIYKVQAYDLGKLGDRIAEITAEAKKYGYGKTVELSIWGHQGQENGPTGRNLTSGPHAVEKKQLDFAGWEKIDFNFDPQKSIAVFYGCNSLSFPQHFLTQRSDLRFAAAFGISSYPSYSNKRYERVDDYESVEEHYRIYYWGRGPAFSYDIQGLTLFARAEHMEKFFPNTALEFGDKYDPTSFPNMTFDRALSVFYHNFPEEEPGGSCW